MNPLHHGDVLLVINLLMLYSYDKAASEKESYIGGEELERRPTIKNKKVYGHIQVTSESISKGVTPVGRSSGTSTIAMTDSFFLSFFLVMEFFQPD